MGFKEFLEEATSFKVGDTVRLKTEYQDSEDDGLFKIVEMKPPRALIQTITHADKFSRIIPTETVNLSWIVKAKK